MFRRLCRSVLHWRRSNGRRIATPVDDTALARSTAQVYVMNWHICDVHKFTWGSGIHNKTVIWFWTNSRSAALVSLSMSRLLHVSIGALKRQLAPCSGITTSVKARGIRLRQGRRVIRWAKSRAGRATAYGHSECSQRNLELTYYMIQIQCLQATPEAVL